MFKVQRRSVLLAAVIAFVFATFANADESKKLKIAAVVTAYYHNSHADVIVSRLVQGYNLDDRKPAKSWTKPIEV